MLRPILCLLVALVLAGPGCTGERLPPPPGGPQLDLAGIPGMPEGLEYRFWGDIAPGSAEEQLSVISRQVAERIRAEGAAPNAGRFDVLALSGGGSDGAYGAGLLNGWTDQRWGQGRPEFGLVTGISVGALIAPFAFLGPEYDDEIERLFTNTSIGDLVEYDFFNALFGNALGVTSIQPLEDIFDRIVDDELLARIAAEHRKGRRLWIGTTYLDAQRPVVWDIGAIAASEYGDKEWLIKKILIASAAIPGAFPPVLIPIEVDGEIYSEMHVDGSVTRQVFVYPSNIDLRQQVDERVPGMQLGTIYVIRNSKLAPDYQPVDPSVLRIVERSLFTLTNALAIGDVSAIEQQADRDDWRLLRSAVPAEFDYPVTAFFDQDYMRALYQVGYQRALDGIAWDIVHDPEAPVDPALAEVVE